MSDSNFTPPVEPSAPVPPAEEPTSAVTDTPQPSSSPSGPSPWADPATTVPPTATPPSFSPSEAIPTPLGGESQPVGPGFPPAPGVVPPGSQPGAPLAPAAPPVGPAPAYPYPPGVPGLDYALGAVPPNGFAPPPTGPTGFAPPAGPSFHQGQPNAFGAPQPQSQPNFGAPAPSAPTSLTQPLGQPQPTFGAPQPQTPPNAFSAPPQPGSQPGPQPFPGYPGPAGGPAPQPGPFPPGGQPGQPAPGYGSPYPGGPSAPPATTHKPSKTLITIIIGVAVLIVLGIGAYFIIPKLTGPNGDEAGVAVTASEAVTEYLTAIAQGNADLALSYAKTQPVDKTFLTNEFLAATMAAGPLDAIKVSEADAAGDWALITASYTIAGNPYQAMFEVSQVDRRWYLQSVVSEIDLDNINTGEINLFINGAALDTLTTVTLFPGSYTLTTDAAWLTVTGNTFVIEQPDKFAWVNLYDFTADLTPEAEQAVRDAAIAELNRCLAEHFLAPPDCGFEVIPKAEDADNIDLGSITWTTRSTSADFTKLDPRLEYDSYTKGDAYAYVSLDFRANALDGDGYYTSSVQFSTVNFEFIDASTVMIQFEK